jgi:hypothetical protein
VCAAALGLALVASGCGGVRLDQSNRLSIGDMRLIVDETVQQFRASPWVAERDATSPPAVITFDRVTNDTRDVITRSELWYLAQAVAGSVVRDRSLRDEKNISMVVPADRLRDARRRGAITAESGADRNPTHTISAVISEIERTDGDVSRVFYQANYQLDRLADGAIVWTDEVVFEREALGRSFN